MANNYEMTVRIGADLREIKQALKGMQKDLKGVSDAGKKAGDTVTKGLGQLEGVVKRARRQVVGLVGAWASLATVKSVIRIADEYKQVNSRLRLAVDTAEEFQVVQEAIFRIAQETNQTLSSTTGLYTRIARATKETNLTSEQRLKIVDTINKSLVISGSSQEAANAALVQLGQGLASGVLRGEELNSVLEQTPRLAKLIADGLGVSIGQLRKLGGEGELTSERVLGAILKSGKSINEEFTKIPPTVSGAITALTNAFTRYIGEADEAGSATQTLAELIKLVAENLGAIIELTLRVGAVIASAFLVKGVAAVRAYTIALVGAEAATSRLVATLGLVQKAFAVVVAAFAGWQIGSYLREEFEVVEKAGIAVAAGVVKAWKNVVAFFQRAGAAIRFALESPLDFFRQKLADLISYMAELADAIPGIGDDIRRGLKIAANAVKPLSSASKQYTEDIKRINAELKREIETADKIFGKMFRDAGAKRQKGETPETAITPGAEGPDSITAGLDLENKARKKARDKAAKIEEEFSQLVEDTRTKTVDETKDLNLIDLSTGISKAMTAFADNDFEGAVEQARKAGEMLQRMKEQGNYADIVLTGMAMKIRDIGVEAARAPESTAKGGIFGGLDSKTEAEQALDTSIDEAAEGKEVRIKIVVDKAGLNEQVAEAVQGAEDSAPPLVIRRTDVDGVPTFSDASGGEGAEFDGLLEWESDKRGARI